MGGPRFFEKNIEGNLPIRTLFSLSSTYKDTGFLTSRSFTEKVLF